MRNAFLFRVGCAVAVCTLLLVWTNGLGLAAPPRTSLAEIKRRLPGVEVPVIEGEFKLVYQADSSFPQRWGINDHCLFRDPQGRIHFFGIVRPFPKTAEAAELVQREMKAADRPFLETLRLIKGRYLYGGIRAYGYIGHAVANNIWGPWQRREPALDSRPKGRQYGSPFVVSYKGRYWMVLPSATGLAVSDDLDHWQEHPTETAWRALGKGHRDPCILRLDDGTFLQYYAANDPRGNDWQSVSLARSRDLLKWERLEPCYVRRLPNGPSWAVLESPFVFRRNGLYYLFACFAHRRYYETLVVASDTPYRFLPENTVTTLFAHAAELIEADGQTYITSCGFEDPQILNRSGLWIARLRWLRP